MNNIAWHPSGLLTVVRNTKYSMIKKDDFPDNLREMTNIQNINMYYTICEKRIRFDDTFISNEKNFLIMDAEDDEEFYDEMLNSQALLENDEGDHFDFLNFQIRKAKKNLIKMSSSEMDEEKSNSLNSKEYACYDITDSLQLQNRLITLMMSLEQKK